ncbi:MAG: hypothetical protein ABI557_18070, partial [Aureliella sp.]
KINTKPSRSMSSEDQPAASTSASLSGSQFLEELERKHTQVLDELDAINVRIENVLKMYAESRQLAGQSPVNLRI